MYIDLVRDNYNILYSTHTDSITKNMRDLVKASSYDELVGNMANGEPFSLTTKEDGGKYVIQTNLLSAEELKEKLIYGERYSLVYQDKNAGGRHIAALYNEHNTFLDLSLSVAAWEKERQECFLGLYVSIGLELLALILIDRLWCREEHARIRKYRQDIENRKARFANKGKT